MNAILLSLLLVSAHAKKDRDRDGIVDKFDKCPLLAEDLDNFMDNDGCPEADNDQDGIPDINDLCPMEVEDHDGFQDGDGCPDTSEPSWKSESVLQVFEQLAAAFSARDPEVAQALFAPDAWEENTVGIGGVPGKEAYAQTTRRGWLLRADPKRVEVIGEARLVFCEVVSEHEGRAVDAVWTVLRQVEGEWRIAGIGKDVAQVTAAAAR